MAQIVTITNPLTGQPAQVDQLDHTAQEIDDAIDRAKAGGEIDIALLNKAPAGYGLGTTPKKITDWNAANVCGWYTCGSGAANSPDSNFGWFGLTYTTGNPEIFVQDVFTLVTTNRYYHRRRLYYPVDGAGTPWEWVNPPMNLDGEYRTTERYQGKPVYVLTKPSKPLGAAGSTVYIEGLPGDIENVIDYRLQIKSSGGVVAMNNRFNSDGSAQCVSNIQVTTDHYAWAIIKCISDCTSLTATCTFKYTKTTN